MSLLDSSITSEQVFPPDYRIFNIGENIELILATTTQYLHIDNRNYVPFIEKQDTSNWLLDAAGTYNAGTITKYLEPLKNELMILAFSLFCDVDMNVVIKMPGSDQHFGTKMETDVAVTPEISPYKEPTITLHSWGTTYVPAFEIENPTEYRNLYLKFGFSGYRYQCTVLPSKPDKYTSINLNLVR